MYTNRKPGVEIVSGVILDIIADHNMIKMEFEQYKAGSKNKSGSVETKSQIFELPDVDLTQFQVGDNATIVKANNDNKSYLLKDGQSVSLVTGSYVSKKDGETKETGITVIRGRLTYAAYKDEKGNMSKAGTPKKEHYDLMINTPSKTHIINIYNGNTTYNSHAIQNAQDKYDGIDFKDNFVTGTFITGLTSGEYTRPDKDGNDRLYAKYFGITNPKTDDLTITPKVRQQSKDEASVEAEAPTNDGFTTIEDPEIEAEIADIFQ